MHRRAPRSRPHRAWVITATFALLATLAPARGALGAEPVDVVFEYTGAEQAFDVPAGVTQIHVVLVGGRGFDIQGGSDPARVEGDLAVVPGTRLYIEVGGDGASGGTEPGAGAGGFNGGGSGGTYDFGFGETVSGGGGGATDIRELPRTNPDSLASRLAVAGGGGGAASGLGGDAGQPGTGGAAGGGAGTASAGGAAGVGTIENGGAGAAGRGGDGGSACSGTTCTGTGGGGGGGGYFGGGGGGGGFFGGGGGGGSSYTGELTNSPGVIHVGSSTPSVSISYESGTPGSPSGIVDAAVTMATSAVCLELSTTSIDFGIRQFGGVRQPAAPSVEIINCSAVGETILARGSDALGDGPTTWALVDHGSCGAETLAPDTFRLTLQDASTLDEVALTTAPRVVGVLDVAGSSSQVALLDTPCPGSSGAGVVMGMQIVFVATE